LAHLNFSLDVLGFAYQVLGEWDKSEQCYREALSISQGLNDWQAAVRGSGYLGFLYFDKGEYVKAKELFQKVYEAIEKAGAKSDQMYFYQFTVPIYIELGEIEEVGNWIENVYRFSLKVKDRQLTAIALALRAMLLRAQKKWAESVEYFEKSLLEFEAVDARRWNVYAFAKFLLCEYARVYLERNQEGDREKAHGLLNQAMEIFQKLGAKKEIERIIAKKKLLTA
jgi:tetratricopeptide (TPR) repeat protein